MKGIPDADRWARLAPLLEKALELPAGERAAFLDGACGGDGGLRADLEALLHADAQADSFLAAPIEPAMIVDALGEAHDPAGMLIGPYRVVREIGRGGMGVVYAAEQTSPRRDVALKVILGGRHVDAAAVRLFQREAESLARLKHPGIATIYESGSTAEGQHYFAMELVQGEPLSTYLEEAGAPLSRPDLRRRLELFRKIAAAVAYAHQRGVIHRDLKPSNILVLPAGDAPDIKVLDFGLARIIDPEAGQATAVTALGHVRGTLPYMSPEQVRGRTDEVDVRTDVYSLGVLLYQMLTGRLPYDLTGASLPEAARVICEQEPLPLRGRFDPDLVVIVRKALEKDPARRYPMVAALDEDLGRYLGGFPILARPASTAYQIRRLVARHRVPVGAAGVLLVLLVGFAIAMTLQARRIAAERDRANREARTATRVSDFLSELFKVSDPRQAQGRAVTAREILDRGVDKLERELPEEPDVQARLLLTMGNVYQNLGDYEKARPLLEKSLAIRRRLSGEENLDALESMNSLALLYQLMGRAAEAEKLYGELIPLRRKLQGEEHPDTLMAMSGLADVYWSQGRYAEKEKLDRRVLEARLRVLGEDHPDTLASDVDVGVACWAQGRFAEAEALFVPALEKQRRILGPDHPSTLITMSDLGDVYDDQGRYAEAESLMRQTLDAERRVLGENHPNTVTLMNDFAMVLQHQKKLTEAEALLRDALAKYRRAFGEEDRHTMGTLSNLGSVVSDEGRQVEAERLLREALGKMQRVLGVSHPDTVSTFYSLGCVAARRRDGAQALDWLDQAVMHGYSDADSIAKNPDFAILRDTPGFDALVARARRNAAK